MSRRHGGRKMNDGRTVNRNAGVCRYLEIVPSAAFALVSTFEGSGA